MGLGATVGARHASKEARALRLVSFVAFFSTLLIYSPNVMVLQGFDSANLTGYFAEPYLMCAFIVAGILAALALKWCFGLDALLERRTTVTAACVLYALSTIGYMMVVLRAPAFGEAWAIACALGSGISMVPIAIAWSRSFSDFDICRAVFVVAVAGGLTALIDEALMMAPPLVAGIAFSVLVILGLLWPLLDVYAPDKKASKPEVSGCAGGEPQAKIHLKAFMSVMGLPLLGMAISSFAMGVQPVFLFGNAFDAQRVGMIVGCAALIPLFFMRGKQPIYSFMYQAYLPLAAAIALVFCVLLATGYLRDVALAAVYGFYCMVSGVAVATSCAIANAREFPRGFVFVTLIGTFCVSAIFGIFLGGRFQGLATSNGTVLVLLTALYGCGMLFAGCLKSWHLMARSMAGVVLEEQNPKAHAETFEERLARVAAEASLSPRETQIVGYVGRGHSSVFVAKTLLISESTVYSHVRNVYRKLGVSSREELIQMLNAPDSPVAPHS